MSLTQPTLYISGLTQAVTDQDIISALHECLRARLKLERKNDGEDGNDLQSPLTGVVEFEKLENAEKAYATLQNYYFPQHSCSLRLSHSSDPNADPKPSARVRLIKFLPPDITAGRLFNIFRPFGQIYRIALNYHHTPDGLPFFSGTAVIEFYTESQASLAQAEMHCSELDRHTIAVEDYDDRRDKSGRGKAIINSTPQSNWAQAAPFVPHEPLGVNDGQRRPSQQHSAHSSEFNDPSVSKWANSQAPRAPYSTRGPHSGLSSPNCDDGSPVNSKWASPTTPQASATASPDLANQPIQKQIDPCNLFIKGLGPDVESGDLFHAFKKFGTIVSARVMKNETTGISKQFGFVSFTTEEAASNALKAMDGTNLGQSSSRIVVRLHELKKFKEGRTKIITVSPPPTAHLDQAHQANSMMAKLQIAESPLPSSSPSLISSPLESRPPTEDSPNTLQQANTLQINNRLAEQTASASGQEAESGYPPAPSRLSSSITTSSNISSCGSPTTLSERDKLLNAVLKLNDPTIGNRMDELIDLLMALPTKEKKICLFNPQILAVKVCEAKEIIEAPDEVTPIVSNGKPTSIVVTNQVTASNLALVSDPQHLSIPYSTSSLTSDGGSPQLGVTSPGSSTRAVSGSALQTPSRAVSMIDSSVPSPGPQNGESGKEEVKVTSLQEIAKLPSKKIIEMIFEKPHLIQDGLIVKLKDHDKVMSETNQWFDEKISKLTSAHQRKQKIGEKLFKILKSFGLKGCPKLTVDLLDSEDLKSLVLLMTLYPEVLKAKVMPMTVQ